MTEQIYRCARGASLRVMYAITSGDASTVIPTQVAMRLKVNGIFTGNPLPLTTAPRAKEGKLPAGFDVLIPSILTKSLQSGDYQLDAMLTIGGVIEETQPCRIRIHQAASSPL